MTSNNIISGIVNLKSSKVDEQNVWLENIVKATKLLTQLLITKPLEVILEIQLFVG